MAGFVVMRNDEKISRAFFFSIRSPTAQKIRPMYSRNFKAEIEK